jgi:DNA-binding NarL/FixJ family response regulator
MILKKNSSSFWVKFQTVTGNPIRKNPKWHLFSFQNISARKLASELTSREIEVLGLIATGKMSKEIADALDISQRTAEKHRENLMQKLKVHDIAGLTRYAISAGIIEVTPG